MNRGDCPRCGRAKGRFGWALARVPEPYLHTAEVCLPCSREVNGKEGPIKVYQRGTLYVVPAIDKRARRPAAMASLVRQRFAPDVPNGAVPGVLHAEDGTVVGPLEFTAVGWGVPGYPR